MKKIISLILTAVLALNLAACGSEKQQVAEGKLEAHEYLNALKAGELHESAAFTERFARYKAQYAFPEEK